MSRSRHSYRGAVRAGLCAALLLAGCSSTGPDNQEPSPDLSFSLSWRTDDSLHVRADVRDWSGPVLLPPFQADNPELIRTRPNIHGLTVRGATLVDSIHSIPWGDDSIQSISISSASGSWALEYDVTFPYQARPPYKTLLPGRFAAASSAYYRGNFLFCLPMYGGNKPAIWRQPARIAVTTEPGAGRRLDGIPEGRFEVRTPYELLFLQFSLDAVPLSCSSDRFRLLGLTGKNPRPDLVAATCADAVRAFSLLDDLFPPDLSPCTIILQDSADGLEGTFSFCARTWDAELYKVWGPYSIAHEILHFRLGVRTGESDMAWWKEATASYLAWQAVMRLGRLDKATARFLLCLDLSANNAVKTVPLSDNARVRDYLYSPDSLLQCGSLVYNKGAQVNMLLDKLLRETGQPGATLMEKTALLCRRYNHRAFTLTEFMSAMVEGNGADVQSLFARYVDAAGPLDTAALGAAFDWLDSRGAFGAAVTATAATPGADYRFGLRAWLLPRN